MTTNLGAGTMVFRMEISKNVSHLVSLVLEQATMLLRHAFRAGAQQVRPVRGEDQPRPADGVRVVQRLLPSADAEQQPVAGPAGVLLCGDEVQGGVQRPHGAEAVRVAGARPRPADGGRGLQVHPGGPQVGGGEGRELLPGGVLLQHHRDELIPFHPSRMRPPPLPLPKAGSYQ